MPHTLNPMIDRITSVARIFSDPKRVEAALSILQSPDIAATELHFSPHQDLSTTAKRLHLLENNGILSSRKDGAHRRYCLARQGKTIELMNALIRFGNR